MNKVMWIVATSILGGVLSVAFLCILTPVSDVTRSFTGGVFITAGSILLVKFAAWVGVFDE